MRMNWAESLYISSRLRTKRLREHVAPTLLDLGGGSEGLRVLDVGCGPGECVACEIDLFGAASVVAIDLDPSMVRRARRRLRRYEERVSVEVGDATQLPFADSSFGAVFNFAVLHHVPDWRAALAEIARVLEPGGRFISQDHDVRHHDWLSRRLFSHPPDGLTNAAFLAELDRLGFAFAGSVQDRPQQLLVVASAP